MTFRPSSSRWVAWIFALALLLKAAVPMLATASAHAQGKPLAEVCTVYGVSTAALGGQEPAPTTDHGIAHAGDHCTLSGLLALSAPSPAAATRLELQRTPQEFSRPTRPSPPDAFAAWVAQLQHGPPAA
jgi:hypothetical protein